jgi:hypothetical protein
MFPHLLPNGLSDVVRGAGTHAAALTLDESGPDRLDVGVFFLIAPDKITNILAIIGELASGNLRLDPLMLLLGKRDRFSHSSHGITLQSYGAKNQVIDAI